MKIITIDTGTTNSRITLWEHDQVVSRVAREVGVRDTAKDGNNQRLKKAIKASIDEILVQHELDLHDTVILASGMITSNVGLLEIPHLTAPAGLKELAHAIVPRVVADVVDKEIWFVSGVKNDIPKVTMDNFEEMDVMRGEEVETIGLIHRMKIQGPAVIILPGSHTKIISIDEQNRITGCLTSLAGELISEITRNTIISNALQKSMAHSFDAYYCLKGFETATKTGLNRSGFSIRILDQFTDLTVNEKANFLLGAVLADDLKALKNSRAIQASADTKVIIAGKDMLKDAFSCIMKHDNYFSEITVADTAVLKDLAGAGIIQIYREKIK